jgi:predicted nucleic acid-binding Zn ribbon protein
MEVVNKTCLTCGKTVRGRSDKKFCDDNCRNNYNNQLKAGENNYVRNINNMLRKNRRILHEILPGNEAIVKTTKDKLVHDGFRFNYITHTYTNHKGNTYFFCYDYGYLPLEQDWVLVVRRNEEPANAN